MKRDGVRISLAEVARALGAVEGVSAATCLLVERDGGPILVAFVEGSDHVSASSLRGAASSQLPAQLLPDAIVVVPSLPTGSTGKVDRSELLRLFVTPPDPSVASKAD